MATRMRYFEERRGRVEIIPMIDVMLFLLVFFVIITLQMIPDAGVSLQLPNAHAVAALQKPEILINVLQDGQMQVKGQAVDQAALTALLRATSTDPTRIQVTIAAAKDTPFQNFVHAMDACRDAGVTDIGIAAQPSP